MDTGTKIVVIGAGRETEASDMTETAMTELKIWEKLVDLVQAPFREGRLAE